MDRPFRTSPMDLWLRQTGRKYQKNLVAAEQNRPDVAPNTLHNLWKCCSQDLCPRIDRKVNSTHGIQLTNGPSHWSFAPFRRQSSSFFVRMTFFFLLFDLNLRTERAERGMTRPTGSDFRAKEIPRSQMYNLCYGQQGEPDVLSGGKTICRWTAFCWVLSAVR